MKTEDFWTIIIVAAAVVVIVVGVQAIGLEVVVKTLGGLLEKAGEGVAGVLGALGMGICVPWFPLVVRELPGELVDEIAVDDFVDLYDIQADEEFELVVEQVVDLLDCVDYPYDDECPDQIAQALVEGYSVERPTWTMTLKGDHVYLNAA